VQPYAAPGSAPPPDPAAAQQSWFAQPPYAVPPGGPEPPARWARFGQPQGPPGYVAGPPGHGPPSPGYGQPLYLPAAHKPGAIPLRPLKLGDILDAAFKIIRFNPRATVGSAVLVSAVAMAIPVIATGILSLFLDLSFDLGADSSSTSDTAGFATAYGAVILGGILQAIGLIFVTGTIAHVTAAAAVGRRLSLSEAWRATAGKRWKLVGMTVLLSGGTVAYLGVVIAVIAVLAALAPAAIAVVFGIVLGISAFVGLVFFWGRVYYLAVPPLMLEPIGVFAALRRSWVLTSRQFWRTIGIALLTMLITEIAGSTLSTPITLAGTFGSVVAGSAGAFVYVLSAAVAQVVTSAFVAPFTSAVTSLQYVDQRIRKEGYDVELLSRAGLTGT
jgi:hypothetical protein